MADQPPPAKPRPQIPTVTAQDTALLVFNYLINGKYSETQKAFMKECPHIPADVRPADVKKLKSLSFYLNKYAELKFIEDTRRDMAVIWQMKGLPADRLEQFWTILDDYQAQKDVFVAQGSSSSSMPATYPPPPTHHHHRKRKPTQPTRRVVPTSVDTSSIQAGTSTSFPAQPQQPQQMRKRGRDDMDLQGKDKGKGKGKEVEEEEMSTSDKKLNEFASLIANIINENETETDGSVPAVDIRADDQFTPEALNMLLSTVQDDPRIQTLLEDPTLQKLITDAMASGEGEDGEGKRMRV